MALPEAVCTVILFGGNHVPYVDSLAALLVLGGVLLAYLIRLLPIAAELVPAVGAFIAGFHLGKHTILTVIAAYLIISVLTVSGRLPLCAVPA